MRQKANTGICTAPKKQIESRNTATYCCTNLKSGIPTHIRLKSAGDHSAVLKLSQVKLNSKLDFDHKWHPRDHQMSTMSKMIKMIKGGEKMTHTCLGN